MMLVPFSSKIVHFVLQDLNEMKIECESSIPKRKNRRLLVNVTLYMLVTVCIGIICGVIFALPASGDDDIYSLFYLVDMFLPAFQTETKFVLRLFPIPAFYIISASPCLQIIYLLVIFKRKQNI